MAGPIRVLHLIATMGYGGIERWLLTMLTAIDREEVAMDVCCRSRARGALAPEAEAAGARVVLCPLGPTHVGFHRCVTSLLREGGYDVLHNHLGAFSGPGVAAARAAGVPVVTTFHNTRFPPKGGLRRPVLRQARALYAAASVRYAIRRSTVVSGVSRSVLAALPGDPGGAVVKLAVAVPPVATAGERAAVRRAEGWPAGTPLVVHVGRFTAQKNHEAVVDVFAGIHRLLPDARLLLVGDGPLRAVVERQVAALGLAASVRLLGQRPDAARLIAAADVLLLPSRHEGYPVVALEANAAGVPVVGTRIAPIVEAVGDGEGGLLRESVAGLIDAAVQLLRDPGRRDELGRRGRERVLARHTPEHAAAALVELYRGALRERRSP